MTEVQGMLGVSLAAPHGCIVGSVFARGRAAAAGIRAGDSIVGADGNAVTCPSTLAPYLRAGQKQVKLTIVRSKGGAQGRPGRADPKRM